MGTGSCRPSFHDFLSLADFLMHLGPHWNHWCCSFAFFILLITQSLQRLLYLPHVYLVDEDFLSKAFFQLQFFSSFFCEQCTVIQIFVSFNMMKSIINEIKIVVTVCRIQCNYFIHLLVFLVLEHWKHWKQWRKSKNNNWTVWGLNQPHWHVWISVITI